ncbi:MAG: hypothetical protein E6I91_16130 [Chloroflexi bacterium]|nr:MAG: hypothetical protein E6I91_16130 [Chloroflexota bacterium]
MACPNISSIIRRPGSGSNRPGGEDQPASYTARTPLGGRWQEGSFHSDAVFQRKAGSRLTEHHLAHPLAWRAILALIAHTPGVAAQGVRPGA